MTPGNPSWSVHFKSVATTMILQFSSDDQTFLNMFSAYVQQGYPVYNDYNRSMAIFVWNMHPGSSGPLVDSVISNCFGIKRTWPDWSRSSNHAAREQDENRNCDGKTQWSCCGSMLEGCENLWDLLVSQRKKRWNFGMPHLGCQSSRGSSWIIIGLECQVRSESEDVSFEVDVLCKEWASCMVTAALWLCKLVVTSC